MLPRVRQQYLQGDVLSSCRRQPKNSGLHNNRAMERVTKLSDREIVSDCRVVHDRRNFDWKTVLFGFLRSRRRGHRRDADPEPMFLDWHHPWLFFLATGIMLLSSLDAFLTLQLINRGAVEINPAMALAMGGGTSVFMASKMLLTGTGVLTLVFLSRSRLFNRFRAGLALTTFFSFYCCLVCYEFVLLIGQL